MRSAPNRAAARQRPARPRARRGSSSFRISLLPGGPPPALPPPIQAAQEALSVLDARPPGQGVGRGPLRPLAHQQEHRRHLTSDPLEDPHHVEQALDGPHVGDVEDYLLPPPPP